MSPTTPDLKELHAIIEWANVTEDVRELSLKVGDVELFVSKNHRLHPTAPPTTPLDTTASPTAATVPSPNHTQAVLTGTTPNASAPVGTSPQQPSAAQGADPTALASNEVLITAPMVGTFYASPQPGAPAFVRVGDPVHSDTVLCIVEVMKLMNTIEAGVKGTVARILVENEQAVEYGQPLMIITLES